jgi:hypothetical protein
MRRLVAASRDNRCRFEQGRARFPPGLHRTCAVSGRVSSVRSDCPSSTAAMARSRSRNRCRKITYFSRLHDDPGQRIPALLCARTLQPTVTPSCCPSIPSGGDAVSCTVPDHGTHKPQDLDAYP